MFAMALSAGAVFGSDAGMRMFTELAELTEQYRQAADWPGDQQSAAGFPTTMQVVATRRRSM